MRCPICSEDALQVLRTVDEGYVIARKRKCTKCGHRFNTLECDAQEMERLKSLRQTLRDVMTQITT